MTTTTTTQQQITHQGTGITASASAWQALGFTTYADGGIGFGPYGIEALLYYGIQETGARDERAVIAAVVERDRRNEAKTASTAQARLAESLAQLASQLGAESAEQLVARLPDKIRPYVQAVLRR